MKCLDYNILWLRCPQTLETFRVQCDDDGEFDKDPKFTFHGGTMYDIIILFTERIYNHVLVLELDYIMRKHLLFSPNEAFSREYPMYTSVVTFLTLTVTSPAPLSSRVSLKVCGRFFSIFITF